MIIRVEDVFIRGKDKEAFEFVAVDTEDSFVQLKNIATGNLTLVSFGELECHFVRIEGAVQ